MCIAYYKSAASEFPTLYLEDPTGVSFHVITATVGAAFEGTYAKQIFTQTIPSWTNRMLGRDRIATVEDPTDADPTPGALHSPGHLFHNLRPTTQDP